MLVFEQRGYRRKPLGAEQRTNSTHIWRYIWESNPGHNGGRRVLSPLRHPCTPHESIKLLKSSNCISINYYQLNRQKNKKIRNKKSISHQIWLHSSSLSDASSGFIRSLLRALIKKNAPLGTFKSSSINLFYVSRSKRKYRLGIGSLNSLLQAWLFKRITNFIIQSISLSLKSSLAKWTMCLN